jgi:hypothetical protein
VIALAGDQEGLLVHRIYCTTGAANLIHSYLMECRAYLPLAASLEQAFVASPPGQNLLTLLNPPVPGLANEMAPPAEGEVYIGDQEISVSSLIALPKELAALFAFKIWKPREFLGQARRVAAALTADAACRHKYQSILQFARAACVQQQGAIQSVISGTWGLVNIAEHEDWAPDYLAVSMPVLYQPQQAPMGFLQPAQLPVQPPVTVALTGVAELAQVITASLQAMSPAKPVPSYNNYEKVLISSLCEVGEADVPEHVKCTFYANFLPVRNKKLHERILFL